MNSLWRAWRTLATILCFATFAIGGLLLGLSCMPPIFLIWRNRDKRHRIGRWVIHRAFHVFVLMMRATGVLRVRFEGLERLRKPGALVLANHPSLIDFVLLASVIPDADCFVKSGLMKDWFKRWPVMLAGYILNDQGETSIAQCRRSLDSGNKMIIFPEGTRTEPGGPVRFQKGAAQVAVRTRQNVTPVLIKSSSRTNLEKGATWYLAPRQQLSFTLRVKEEIPVQPFLQARPDQPALAARDFNRHLQLYFNEVLLSERA